LFSGPVQSAFAVPLFAATAELISNAKNRVVVPTIVAADFGLGSFNRTSHPPSSIFRLF
jgi:hypothetical protein